METKIKSDLMMQCHQIDTKLEDFYRSFYKRPLLEHFELSISSGDYKKTKHTEKEAIA